jgi:hypothetical protein
MDHKACTLMQQLMQNASKSRAIMALEIDIPIDAIALDQREDTEMLFANG